MSTAYIELQQAEQKGPVLAWPGKALAVRVAVPEMRLRETFAAGAGGAPSPQAVQNLLLHGDNKETLAWLLANGYGGAVKLIYIDPPFDSDGIYTSAIRLRGPQAKVIGNSMQYSDRWQGSDYLQFMAERLLLLKEVLHVDGTIWLHCDRRASARLYLLMEEIFGADAFLNTIAWRSQVARGAKVHARYFPHSTHSIHIFTRSPAGNPTWHSPRREILLTRAEAAAQYKEDVHGFFRTSHPGTYSFKKLVELHAEGRIYAPYDGHVIVDVDNRRVYASNGGNIGVKYYLEQRNHNCFVVSRSVDNLWDDIPGLGTVPSEDVNYPTQKTEGLLRRIIETATDPGDIVLDAFVGSGTSVAVAQKLGRRWIGCDENRGAIRTTASRIQRGCEEAWRRGDGNSWDNPHAGFAIYRLGAETLAEPGAQVSSTVEPAESHLTVTVQNYVNPMLEKRLRQAGEPIPVDWRALVQSIAIDSDYDGEVFHTLLLDAPGAREEMVKGSYRLPLQVNGTIALCIVDLLGTETIASLDR